LNHGGGQERAVGADIVLRRDAGTVHIRFGDTGARFNPLDAPPPGLEGDAESRAVGGLGVHLIRQLTTAAAYRRADDRNILDMEMTLPAVSDRARLRRNPRGPKL
ncbi:MAG: ATP-binding protein, partial [Proteobacteria bacterium]|nr:ATP-binding protein [Pseudomonadota bacterium]